MVTVTNFARFNLSALPKNEQLNVANVIETLRKSGSNALGALNAKKVSDYKNTYVIRTLQGTRIVAEIRDSRHALEVTDVYPGSVFDQATTTISKVRVEKSRRGKIRSNYSPSGSE